MGFSARILLDSISPAGVRLTTMEVSFPRFVLSEFNTHRMFCLEEHTKLYFDLPAGKNKRETQRYTMTLREFYEKWNGGAASRKNRARTVRTDKLCLSPTYSAKELAKLVGYQDYTAVDLLTRRTNIPRVGVKGAPYRVRGLDFARWFYTEGSNRQPMRERLRSMHLRSCNEETGEIYHTHVNDICYSGKKDVFRVVLRDGREILSSKDHQFLTRNGWQRLEDAVGLELSTNNIATWRHRAEFAMNGVEAFREPEWLKAQRDNGYSARAIAEMAGVTLDQIKYQFKKHGIRVSNFSLVWQRSHTKEAWNKGRRYSNLKLRGRKGTARVRKGAESQLWRGGVTPERKLIGAWTRGEAFRIHRANGFRCVLCNSGRDLHAHHVDPVAHNPERARDVTNLTTLCSECHGSLHQRNLEVVLLDFMNAGGAYADFWDVVGDTRPRKPYEPRSKRVMLRHFVPIERVEYVGVRDTYDIEVTGPYHNFIADGFVVHNSRNSASSRAIPTAKLIERVETEPATPVEWGRNQKGMSAEETIDEADILAAQATWLTARDEAVKQAKRFAELHVHKQITNRILEPFMWHTVIVTATEWANFFALRCSPNAQPEIHAVADLMRDVYEKGRPKPVAMGEWHLPLIQDDERSLPIEEQMKMSVARCARVSYLTHEGKRNAQADIDLFTRLKNDRHLSPFEHVATPSGDTEFHANFRGWTQMRKQIETQLPHAEAGAD